MSNKDLQDVLPSAISANSDNSEIRREQLRLLLQREAILYADQSQPVKDRKGHKVPWLFYSWNISLSQEGARLAGLCLLDRLQTYTSTQIATYGYTAMPLLSACVLLSGGKYKGICIRETRKNYGSCRQIEGRVDKNQPVVILDDSISSGNSMRKAIQALEAEGLQVEGGLALVNFPFRGGMEWANALGYRIEALFDIWQDLHMPRPIYVAGFRRLLPGQWGPAKIADGLDPVQAARATAISYLSHGQIPRPPSRLDREYDNRGGVYVSFREPQTERRVARDGFWHFHPEDADVCRDLVLATIKTINSARSSFSFSSLNKLKIAVTFFGPLEKIPPQKLDFGRYGIVVQSRAWETKLGGALPNTQVFTSEIEQYTHARVTNAGIANFEPHDLYRHTVAKYVEAGEYWLPFGTSNDPNSEWTNSESVGKRLTERARQFLLALATNNAPNGEPLPDDLITAPVFAIAVTLYHRGIAGCSVAWDGSLDSCLMRATRQATKDQRFAQKREGRSLDQMDLAISILHDREWLGEISLERAARKVRRGLDSLSVQQQGRRAIFLPSVAPHFNWSKEKLAQKLLQKAGIAKPPFTWATFRTTSWLRSEQGTFRLSFGFPERRAEPDTLRWKKEIESLGNYIMNHLGPEGLPEYLYFPVTEKRVRFGTAARVVHALMALEIAGRLFQNSAWREASLHGLSYCLQHCDTRHKAGILALPGQQGGPMADCQLLAALVNCGKPIVHSSLTQAIAVNLLELIQADGRITAHPKGLGLKQDHDFLPGVILWALAQYWIATGDKESLKRLTPPFEWYRRRFRLLHPWGMVGWQTQAWATLYKRTHDSRQAEFVFEMADWAMDWQLEKSGAFVTDLNPSGPSFHTAFLAEGIAAAWTLAREIGDQERTERYAQSCREAARFMTKLIIYPEDTYCMPDPEYALGGVRSMLTDSDVRIDYVSHTLLSLVQSSCNLGSKHMEMMAIEE